MKVLISTMVLYFLVLVQTSFLVHFTVFDMVPNFVLAIVILWNIFEDKSASSGLYIAIIAGFLLDIFSNRIIGFNIIIMLTIAIFLKVVFKNYVQIPFFKN